jgi:HprK-related kinase A
MVPGVQITIGPFLVCVRSELAGVRKHLDQMYEGFPMHEGTGGHFDIAVEAGRGLHRWVRPQANIVINGARPFLPLPCALAGACLEWAMNWCIGKNAHRWIAVHAAVAERGGRTLILPGPSGSGKSTLCASLTGAGWRLFSDEFALIDPESGWVLPVPRPISLKNRAIEIVRDRQPSVVFGPEGYDTEGARFVHMRPPGESVRRASEPASVGWVVVPRFAAGRPTTLEPLPKARALLQLTDQSFNYNYLGARGYTCLAALVRHAECFRLEYSDLDDVLGRLEDMAAN